MTSIGSIGPADPPATAGATGKPPSSPAPGPSFLAVLNELRQETALGAPAAHAGHTLPETPLFMASPAPVVTRPAAGGMPSSDASTNSILQRAQAMVGTPYVWGGNSAQGVDCSAFVSRAWGINRQTTETLPQHAHPISKDQLQAGDALNLKVGADPDGYGHVRLFDRWADPGHTQMWVYEATPPRVVHHVIPYDPAYQPLRHN